MPTYRPVVTDHPLVGKRVNRAGHAATVTHVNDGVAWVAFDVGGNGVILESVAAAMPPLVARESFDYRPGDRR